MIYVTQINQLPKPGCCHVSWQENMAETKSCLCGLRCTQIVNDAKILSLNCTQGAELLSIL